MVIIMADSEKLQSVRSSDRFLKHALIERQDLFQLQLILPADHIAAGILAALVAPVNTKTHGGPNCCKSKLGTFIQKMLRFFGAEIRKLRSISSKAFSIIPTISAHTAPTD